ncbi:MAG TPA: CRISPR-associated endonuclease Cas1 [Methylomirabilota bacterium]|jgi:CRISPR-associated protein Cas1|nr:CRISPR-associated endonuclease Cas1 [Methylomirabilota bacterium]
MANLYLIEQGSVLRKTGDRLIVEKDDKELLEVECFKIDTIFLFGNIHVTTPALTELLEHGIELALLTQGGRLKGQLTPPKAKNVLLRMAQYRRSQDPAWAMPLARTFVDAKVRNACALLTRQQRNYPERGFAPYREELDRLRASIASADTLDSLRGVEGAAARSYFAGLALACRTELTFEGRRRRPPTDPVNALLSFGYTLVGAELASLLDAMGFDPYIGFYHQLDYGRPSLALDLLEEFRVPAVDRLVLNLVNLRTLQASDFVIDEESGGLRLDRKALGKFFRAYEGHLNREISDKKTGATLTLRKAFQQQAERLAAQLTKGEAYVPFLAEW